MTDVPTFPMPDAYSRLCAALVPASYGASRQWYRRAIGGQWSYAPSGRWSRVRDCPAPYNMSAADFVTLPDECCTEHADGTPVCRCEHWPVPAPWHPSPRVLAAMDVIVWLFA